MEPLTQLRNKGYRITTQRKSVLQNITSDPLTVEEIFSRLKKKNINIDLASIYRTLVLLKNSELITQVDFGDGRKRYELVGEKNHHHHLICNTCGRIENVYFGQEAKILKEISLNSQFAVQKHTLELFGLCKHCQ